MTPDQMNPNICSSALDENGNNAFANDEGEGGHKWDEETGECNECGAQGVPVKHICECGNEHELTGEWTAV